MAMIPKETIDKIRESNNIVDVIGEYISLEQKGKNYVCVCPFHNDHNPSMSVSSEKQIFTCFSCGATGNVIGFVQRFESISFVDALNVLASRAGINEIKKSEKKDSFLDEYINIYSTTNTFYKNNLLSKEGKEAREYLTKRGLDKELLDTFEIGLSLNNKLSNILAKKYNHSVLLETDIAKENENELYDTFKNRIMFPLKDKDGNIIAFSGRVYYDSDESKYVNTRETKVFKKGTLLYNYHLAREHIRREKEVIICEGYMDVIRLHSIGIKNTVAIMGTSFTKEQKDLIKGLKARVVLNLDQDTAGKEATLTIGDSLLKDGIETSIIVFSGSKDTDDYIFKNGSEPFLKAYQNKVSYLDFKLDYLKQNKNLSDSVEVSKYIAEAIESINSLNDDILKELKIKELSREFDIDDSILRARLIENKKVFIEKPKELKTIPKKKRLNKYEISEIRILYLMLNDEAIIKIYENNLGYLIDEKLKDLADEIIEFKLKFKYYNFSEFIDYISEKQELTNTLEYVMGNCNIGDYTEEEVYDYITNIKESSVVKQIKKLNEKLRNTIDINEKIMIAKKIENMKKEVLKW